MYLVFDLQVWVRVSTNVLGVSNLDLKISKGVKMRKDASRLTKLVYNPRKITSPFPLIGAVVSFLLYQGNLYDHALLFVHQLLPPLLDENNEKVISLFLHFW